jgi:spore maturation protein CgeB
VPISPHGNRRSSISIFPSPADPYWGIWPIASACVGPALHCAVDAALYRPQNLQPTWDLGYLGTYARDRQPALERLLLEPARRLPDRRFVIAGPQYPDSIAWPANVERIEHLPPAQHAAFYCRQRFTLNVTRADMVRTGWSPSVRLFEAAACGAPVISDRWPGLDALLPDGVAIMIADDADEVVSVLCGLDDGRRLRISSSARDIVLADHTGVARGRELEQNLCACMDESPTQDFSSYASDLIEQGYRDLSPHLASCFLVAVRPRKSHDHVRD